MQSDLEVPSDTSLTETGLAPRGTGRVLVLACGALAREIIALTRDFDHIDLQCLPAIYHNHPEKIVPAIRETLATSDSYEKTFVVYADCGTGGALAEAAKELGVEMMPGPHCYAFFQGTDDFMSKTDEEFTAFYLTDFLVRQFDAFVWKPLGLDRNPELRDMYFGNYDKLVYQAQTNDAELRAKAEDCANRLGLAFEYRFTGFGDLADEMARLTKS